jgi:hypothetical protein
MYAEERSTLGHKLANKRRYLFKDNEFGENGLIPGFKPQRVIVSRYFDRATQAT